MQIAYFKPSNKHFIWLPSGYLSQQIFYNNKIILEAKHLF